MQELYFAWALLTEDSKKKKNRRWPDKTFEGYCDDIEINKDTGYAWLRKYFNVNRGIVGNPTIPPDGPKPTISRQKAEIFLKHFTGE